MDDVKGSSYLSEVSDGQPKAESGCELKIWESSPINSSGVSNESYIRGEQWRVKLNAAITTSEHVAEVADATDIFEGLIFHPKVTAWVAQPGAGKTAMATKAAAHIASIGYEVLYFQADAGLSDLKHYVRHAEESGYQLLSNLRVGDSVLGEIIEGLAEGNLGSERDLSNVVMFIDTLKKFCNVINKDSKEFYKLVRAISVRGGSVIMLGHCNKHKDSNGNLIYEGTGDLKADIDVLTYWYEVDEGSNKRVSSQHDKDRAPLSDRTFLIDKKTREVTLVDFEDVRERLDNERQEEDDKEVITFIQNCFIDRPIKQGDLVKQCADDRRGGRNSILKILERYEGKHWERRRVSGSNAIEYFPIGSAPPKQTTDQTNQTKQTLQVRPSIYPY